MVPVDPYERRALTGLAGGVDLCLLQSVRWCSWSSRIRSLLRGSGSEAAPQQQLVGESSPLGSIGVALTKLLDDFVEGGGEFVREILAETFS